MFFKKNKIENNINGFIDGISNGFIMGWALDRSDLEQNLELEIFVDGVVITRSSANHMRTDIMDEFQSGRHGFAIPITKLIIDSKNYFKIGVAGTNTEIPWINGLREHFYDSEDSKLLPPKISEGLFGSIRSSSPGLIEGWVWSEEWTKSV